MTSWNAADDIFVAEHHLAHGVEVTDELFARLKEHFSDTQVVEITALLTLVNVNRFNAAFGIGSAGFSDGMVCVLPDRPQPAPSVAALTPDSRPA